MSVEVIYGRKQKAYTSHIVEDGTFFVQLNTKEAHSLSDLSENIARHIKKTGKTRMVPEYGYTCFACSETDRTWYRALICSEDHHKVQVFYVDYGNTEELTVESINAPTDSFFEMPYQSICCTIANFTPVSSDFGTKLGPLILDRETSCVFLSKSGSQSHPFLHFLPCYNVLLYENETSDTTLAEFLIMRNLGHYAICLDTVEVGTKQNVIVSFVDSPGKFWVQLSKNSEAQEKIMEDLNSTRVTCSLKALPQTALREGVSCCCVYTEDGRYYRAEIEGLPKSSKSSGKIRVWFGDYGNTETVPSKDVMTLPYRLTRMPFSAIMCSLDGVLPVKSDKPHPKLGNIAWTPEASQAFSDIIMENEYEANFVGEISPEVYDVQLTDPNTGKDVGKVLAQAGIVERSAQGVASDESQGEFEYLSLDVGQTYNKIYITHVESPGVVWCQRPEYVTQMQQLADSLQTEGPNFPALDNPEEGSLCCALYSEDGSWYRASVESVDSSHKTAQVLFVDYGNSGEVSVSDLKVLPSKFLKLPAQAISFSLATITPRTGEDWSEEACECIKSLLTEQEMNCTVVGLDAYEYPAVQLCNPQSNSDVGQELVHRGYASQQGSSAEAGPVSRSNFEYLSLDVGQTYNKIYITHVESPGVVWCQRPEYVTEMQQLADSLQTKSHNFPALDNPEEGSLCCALYSEDGSWYRASVESVDSSHKTAQVLFVDYGNSEEVSVSDLKALPSKFLKLPAQAISFSLAAITPRTGEDWSEEACECIKSLLTEQEMNCIVVGLDVYEYPAVNLSNPLQPDSDIGRELVRQGFARGQQPSQPSPQKEGPQAAPASPKTTQTPPQKSVSYSKVILKAGSTQDVLVAHVESLTEFYCQLSAQSAELDELMEAISNHCSSPMSSALGTVLPNQPVLAMYSEDGAWYRAQVQSTDKESISVKFVDYGNSEPVLESALKKITDKLLKLPAQAIRCSLYGVTEAGEDAKIVFSKMTQDQSFSLTVKQVTSSGAVVADLKDNNKSTITQQLIQRGLIPTQKTASPTTSPQSNIQPPRFTVNTPTAVVTSNIESPFRFHLQFVDDYKTLQTLTDEVNGFYSRGGKSLAPKEGQFCVAKYSEDGVWYRARITSMSGDQINVEFVDYGNSETTTSANIRALEPHFLSVPCLAVPCCLHGLAEGESNEELAQAFSGLVYERELNAEFLGPFTNFESPISVKLFDDKTDVLQACLRVPGSAPQQRAELVPFSPNLKTPISCQVTYVASCREFYCQLSSEADSFAAFMDELYNFYEQEQTPLSAVTVGAYCAAPYSDGSWYRGIVTGTTSQSVTVFYCDYGNTEVVSLSMLKELDSRFCSRPVHAVKCTLGDHHRFDSEECKNAFEQAVLDIEGVTVTFSEKLPDGCFKASVRVRDLDISQTLEQFVTEHPVNPQEIVIPIVKPTINTPLQCSVSFINSCSDFYCQLTANSEPFDAMMNELYSFYEEGRGVPLSAPTIGSYCAAPFTDGSWYRGTISALSGQDATIHYIDYGNTDTVPLSDLYQLDPSFCQLPVQAIQCSLSRANLTSVEDTVRLQEFTSEQVEVTFSKQTADRYEVTLTSNGVDFVSQHQVSALGPQDSLQIGTPVASQQVSIPSITPALNSATQCTVSVINNCSDFYCQLMANSEPFDAMMNELYSFYEEGRGVPLSVPTIGSYCAAPFTDGSWYRGTISALSDQDATVHYIDYGNTDTVPLSDLYQLDPSFCQLPVQAIQCSLSRANLTSVEDTVRLQEFTSEQVEVTFSKQTADRYEVTLTSNGVDFVSQHQVSALGPQDSLQIGTPVASQQVSIPSITPALNSATQCTVSVINNCSDFYCQLTSNSEPFDAMMNELYSFYEEGRGVPLSAPTIGSYCAAPFTDGSWYRGTISALSDQDATVHYIDYGNTDTVPLSDLYQLDPSFCQLPVHAICCSLKGVAGEEDNERFEQFALELQVEVTFTRKLVDRYEVKVSKDGVSFKEEVVHYEPQSSQLKTLTPVLNTPIECTVSYVASCEEFYCQLSTYSTQFEDLMNNLYNYYEEEGRGSVLADPAPATYCAALFGEDGSWYRGIITALSSQTASVFYMDYGNTSDVELLCLRQLEPQFCSLPVQAVMTSLPAQYSSQQCSEVLNKTVLNQVVEVTFFEQLPSGSYLSKLRLNGEDIEQVLSPLASSHQPAPPPISIPRVTPECGPLLKCTVSFVASCEEFYCQLSSESAGLENLMNKLYAFYVESGESRPMRSPTVGSLCAVPYTDDSWYRGRITAISNDSAQVLYIDYGNSDTLSLAVVQELEPQFSGLCVQAVKCCLKDLSPKEKGECEARFQELVLENEVFAIFEPSGQGESYSVSMEVNGRSLNEILVEVGLAGSPRGMKSPLQATSCQIALLSIHPGFTGEVFVTVVNSSTEFYCQLIDQQERLDLMMLQIRTFCEGSGTARGDSQWREKEFVLACFSEDMSWYRAQILQVGGDNTAKVFYVDYGNSEVLKFTELRKITPEFCQLPAQALKCALEGSLVYTYDERSYDQWNDLLLNQEMKLKCVSVRSDGSCSVDLERLDTGVDVMSLAISEKVLSPRMVDPTVEPTERNIGAVSLQSTAASVQISCVFPVECVPDSFHDMFVQHVESPSLFYGQFGQFHKSQLESLMNIMQDYYTSDTGSSVPVPESSCTEGCFLAAQYSEDELWYRCLVQQVSEAGALVRFIDYGNGEVVPLDKLRFLDPEFAKLPAQGVPCSLALVSPLGSNWTDDAIDKFAEMVAEKSVMGQVKTSSNLAQKPFTYNGTDTVSVVLKEDVVVVGDELIRQGLACDALDDLESPVQESAAVYSEFLKLTKEETIEMYKSHIDSLAQFWLQMPTADDVLTILQAELAAAYEGQSNVVLASPQVGSACCARFSEDGGWYRAVVASVSPEGVTVRYVDYGNSETVDPSQVFALQPNFLSTPVQAIECSLSNVPDSPAHEEAVSKFSALVTDKELLVTFKNQLGPNKWEVTLLESGEDIGSALFPVASVTEKLSEMTIRSVSVPTSNVKVGETYPVYVAFADSPSKFFCQLVSESDKLEALMAEVGDFYSGSHLEVELTAGAYCVAQYSGSWSWYRAQVTAVHSEEDIVVHFLDYGNSEHVQSKQICGLEARFSELPAQGIPCSLTQDLSVEFPSEVLDQFFQYDLDQEFKIKMKGLVDDRYVVDLYDQAGSHVNASILGLLVSPPAQLPAVAKQSYVHLKFEVGISIDAYISNVNSPTSFYCQPLDLAADLDQLMNQISSLMASTDQPPLVSSAVAPGKICLAQFSEDDGWYRALVKEVNDPEVTVLYVDYGNAETIRVGKIVELPQQFQACVVQAIHCSAFEGLDTGMSWSEEHIAQFQELVSQSDNNTATITSISKTGQYSVEISANGEAIDFSSLLERQVEEAGTDPQPPLRSLASGPTGLAELSKLPREGSAASSASLGSGSESLETETDTGSVGEPLIKAPFKLSLAVEESLDVNVVYVQSPSLFYIQRADCQSELDNLSEEIEQYCASLGESLKEFSLTFHKGDYVLAKYSLDDAWYRAEVTRVDSEDGTTEVSFIDYGNIELVAPEDLVICPENLLELPAQAIPCSLARVPRRDSWPFEYKDLINNLVEGKVLRATVEVPSSQGMRPNVKLVDVQTDTDLSDQVLLKLQDECEVGSDNVIVELPEGEDLEQEESPPAEPEPQVADQSPSPPTEAQPRTVDLEVDPSIPSSVEPAPEPAGLRVEPCDDATVSTPGLRLLKEREWEVGSTHSVLVVSCEHPHSFICQLTSESDTLESVTAQLAQLPLDPQCVSSPPKGGDILAAQFSEDLSWCRARVESSTSEGLTEVTFIDYGNSEAVTLDKLSFLTESLLSHPPLAVECFLSGVETCSAEGVFSEDAAGKLLELVGEEEATIKVVSVDTAGHLGVLLTTSAGVNVGKSLIECKLASPLVPSPQTHSVDSSAKELDGSLPEEKEEPIVSTQVAVSDAEPPATPNGDSETVVEEKTEPEKMEEATDVPSGESVVAESPTHLNNSNTNNNQNNTVCVLTCDELALVEEEVYARASVLPDSVLDKGSNGISVDGKPDDAFSPANPVSDITDCLDVPLPASPASESAEYEELGSIPATPESSFTESIEPVPVTPELDDTEVLDPIPITLESDGKETLVPIPVTPKSDITETLDPIPVTPESDITETSDPIPVTPESDITETSDPIPVTPKSDITETLDPIPVTPESDITETSDPMPVTPESDITETSDPIPITPESDTTEPSDPVTITTDSDDTETSYPEPSTPESDDTTCEEPHHSATPSESDAIDCVSSSPVREQEGGSDQAEDVSSEQLIRQTSTPLVKPLSRASGFLDQSANTNGNNNNDYAVSLPAQSLTQGARYPVRVLSVYSPEEFVCVLTENADSLKQITDEMAQLADSLPAVTGLAPGVPVAFFRETEKEWCRAVVRSVGVLLDIIKVYCVDTGSSDMISQSKLKPLLTKHAALPPQALKCQLRVLCETDLNPDLVAVGEPWELTWPVSCTRHLNQLIQKSGELYLEILASSNGDSVYEVKLLDCSTEMTLDLREVLVERLRNPTELVTSSPTRPIKREQSFEDDALVHEDCTQPLHSDSVQQITEDMETATIHPSPAHPSPASSAHSSTEGTLKSTEGHTVEEPSVPGPPESTPEVPAVEEPSMEECSMEIDNKLSLDQPVTTATTEQVQLVATEILLSETQAVVPESSHEDSDFIDGETSASTGEGDVSTGRITEEGNGKGPAERGEDVTAAAECGRNGCSEPVSQSNKSTLQSLEEHASDGSFVIV